jgi:hypothetical protein
MTRGELVSTIVRMVDKGARIQDICAAVDLKQGAVYTIIREHRPNRARQKHARWSDKRAKIRALAGPPARASAARIAELVNCSTAYVHRILSEEPPK